MTPSIYMANLITFSPRIAASIIAAKARARKISAGKILKRQCAFRRIWGIEYFDYFDQHAHLEDSIEVVDIKGDSVFFRMYDICGKKHYAYGETVKAAYQSAISSLRYWERFGVLSQQAISDNRLMAVYRKHEVKAAKPDLMTSDILAPKRGRKVN